MTKIESPSAFLTALVTAAVVSACGGPDSSNSLSSAKSYLEKKDNKAAVIQLKNALQKTPDSPEARFLLGTTYLADGDATSAVLELRRALDLKYPADKVIPELARAMLRAQQEQKVIEQFADVTLADKAAAADLKVSLASAYSTQKDNARARAAIDAALTFVPDYAPAVRVQAILAAQAGQYDDALAVIDKLLAHSPRNVEALHTRGELLLYGKHDVPGAVASFRQALSVDPSSETSRASLITTLLAENDLEAAAKEIEVLRKTLPRQPQTAYFDAQLAFFRNDFKRAHEITDQLARLAPDSVQVRQLGGAVELKLGLLLEAERSLSRAIQLAPNLDTSRRLLAETYLQLDRPSKALEVLAPLLAGASNDSAAVSLAAEANLQLGNFPEAQAALSKAVALDPKDVRSRVALALSKLRGGRQDETVAELREVAASDKSTYADMTLASLYIRNRDFANALKSVDAVESKRPGQAMTANLRGRVYLMHDDAAQARKSFEKALSIDPTFVPAAATLASLDLADKQPEMAQKRFESILKVDPKNLDALMALAGMRAKGGASYDEIVGLIRNVIKLNPTASPPRLLLIDRQIEHQDLKGALATAWEAVNALPASPLILDALGRAQTADGDANQAMSTFKKLATLEPTSPTPYLRLASIQATQRDTEGAIENYKKALALDPDRLEAQSALAALQLAAGRPEQALAIAKALQKRFAGDPTGYLIEGAVESSQNKPSAAAEVYRTALNRFPSSQIAAQLHSALVSANRRGEADNFAASWVASHPNSAEFNFSLGEAAMARHDSAVAEARFREVVKVVPDNAAALNNLAWVLAVDGKPGAVDYAKKATALVPQSSQLWDTLAFALVAEHRLSEAIEAQSKAVALAPGHSAYRVSLARLHLEAGSKAAARAELDTVSKAADRAAVQAQVDALNQKF